MIKSPQFQSNPHQTWSKQRAHVQVMLLKSQQNRSKIADFLSVVYFLVSIIFFESVSTFQQHIVIDNNETRQTAVQMCSAVKHLSLFIIFQWRRHNNTKLKIDHVQIAITVMFAIMYESSLLFIVNRFSRLIV